MRCGRTADAGLYYVADSELLRMRTFNLNPRSDAEHKIPGSSTVWFESIFAAEATINWVNEIATGAGAK